MGAVLLANAITAVFKYDFLQRALVAAVLVGITAPAVGIFLVQRRLALIGDGLGHVAVTGVALGLVVHRTPVLIAVIVAVLGAVAIEIVRAASDTTGEIALAVLFYGGIAGGVVLVSTARFQRRQRRFGRMGAQLHLDTALGGHSFDLFLQLGQGRSEGG